jgi:ribosomal protein S18 acetylase RimI-like enzyme
MAYVGAAGREPRRDPVEVRDGCWDDLSRILVLLKQAKRTVGFLTDEAVQQRIRKGTLLVALVQREIVGYLLYDLPSDNVTIRQLAVDPQARNLGVGRGLVEELANRYHGVRSGLRLWCRRDYEANVVWDRLGFSPRGERRGRGKDDTTLTLWWRSLGQPDLFSFAREEDDRPLAALDTNLLIRGSDGDPEVVEDLLSDWVRAEIVFGCVDYSLVEINGKEDSDVRRRHIRYATGHEELKYAPEAAEVLRATVHDTLGSALAARHREDIVLATRAAASGARWFVTEDVPFRTACSQVLSEIAEIDVVSISEMVMAADRLARGESYEARFLKGTDIRIGEVATGDLDRVAKAFLNQRDGETLRVWRKRLHAVAIDVLNTRLYLFRDKGDPLALVAITSGDVLEIPVCRIRRGPGEPTLARQILGWLRDKTVEMGAPAVQITDEHPGQWIERSYVTEGFFPDRKPTAVPIKSVTTIAGLGELLAEPPLASVIDPEHVRAISRLSPSAVVAHSIESAFHPVIVTSAGLRTVRVPITSHYAIELFDDLLSEGRLWTRDRSIALRREHVYFRTPTVPSLLNAPARILWQVTGDKRHGGGTLRACSLLDEMIIGDVDQLINRYSHLGVLDRSEILPMTRDGKVMAIRFSHTTLFRHPVTLADYRGIVSELEPGVGLAHAGPQPVTEHVFTRVAAAAA